MTTAQQSRFWLAAFAGFLLLVWLFSPVLLPFVAGLAIAYLLDPSVDRLELWGLPRWAATAAALLMFMLAIFLAALLLVPLIQAQVAHLLDVLPGYAARAREAITPLVENLVARLSPDDVARLRGAVGQHVGDVAGWIGGVVRGVLSSGVALFDVLSVLFITPIVAFYLLRDWDRLVAAVDSWLPRRHLDTVRAQCREIDATLAGFLRGQAAVCMALGGFYAVALSLAGLDFALVIGLLSGILSFIPYVGSLFGLAASVGLAALQFDELWRVGLVAGIFIVGQAAEGNFLTPKLVGDRVGLHPVWVMFSLLAGGALFGFLGVLLAVPVAASLGVVVRFLLRQYLASPLYRGTLPP
ncbi:MAG TPA: AI-2E family transporter [Azospirillaceae bacterium]|nr:AI-2E family transporter [Azospirillaceae bacterium]